MKNRSYLHIAAILACIITTYACKKTTPGYLSPYVYYQTNPIEIPKGRTFLSDPFDPDGSTQPYTVTVGHYYNKATGKIVDSLFTKKYPVLTYTGYIDPKTDTTAQLIESKVKTENLLPISILPASGQLSANSGAVNLPGGEYQFDLKITNISGTKTYSKIGDFVLIDTTDFDAVPAIGTAYDHLFEVGHESTTGTAAAPIVTITHDAPTPNTITFRILDKNGVPFLAKNGEIVQRPNTGVNPTPPYLEDLEEYALSHTYTDQASVFTYLAPPFPLVSLGNGYNYYYRIPTQFFHLDGQPDGKWSLNPRVPARFYALGAYTITLQLPDVTHK